MEYTQASAKLIIVDEVLTEVLLEVLSDDKKRWTENISIIVSKFLLERLCSEPLVSIVSDVDNEESRHYHNENDQLVSFPLCFTTRFLSTVFHDPLG